MAGGCRQRRGIFKTSQHRCPPNFLTLNYSALSHQVNKLPDVFWHLQTSSQDVTTKRNLGIRQEEQLHDACTSRDIACLSPFLTPQVLATFELITPWTTCQNVEKHKSEFCKDFKKNPNIQNQRLPLATRSFEEIFIIMRKKQNILVRFRQLANLPKWG